MPTPPPLASPAKKRILVAIHWANDALIEGVLKRCVERGWEGVVVRAEHLGEVGDRVYDGAVTGLPEPGHPVHEFIKKAGLPVVELSHSYPENTHWCRLPTDSAKAGRLAADCLRRQPVAAFAFVSNFGNATDAEREKGFRDALLREGDKRPLTSHVYRAGGGIENNPLGEANLRLKEFIRHLPKPAGVFGSVDAMARIVCDVALDAGIPVPESLRIMGYGDRGASSRIAPVPITTIGIDYSAWGCSAAAMLDELMSGKIAPGTTRSFPPGSVIERASTDGGSGGDPLCTVAIRIMRENLRTPPEIADLAARLGVSPSTLKRAFAATLGTGVAEYHLGLRIEAAKGLLAAGDKVEAVADAVGFNSARSLRKAFIKKTGITPGGFSTAIPDGDAPS